MATNVMRTVQDHLEDIFIVERTLCVCDPISTVERSEPVLKIFQLFNFISHFTTIKCLIQGSVEYKTATSHKLNKTKHKIR